jgi:hypothetical protein
MLKTEVRNALHNFVFDRIKQTDGMVRVDFLNTIFNDDEQEEMQTALQSLLHIGNCSDIYISLMEHRGNTYVFVHKAYGYKSVPTIHFDGFTVLFKEK